MNTVLVSKKEGFGVFVTRSIVLLTVYANAILPFTIPIIRAHPRAATTDFWLENNADASRSPACKARSSPKRRIPLEIKEIPPKSQKAPERSKIVFCLITLVYAKW